MKIKCSGCGCEVEIIEKVGFRQTCETCDTWLHSCVHCCFWSRGGCMEPSAEKVGDPEAMNYCEWFKARIQDEGQDAEEGGGRASAEEMWRKLTKK